MNDLIGNVFLDPDALIFGAAAYLIHRALNRWEDSRG